MVEDSAAGAARIAGLEARVATLEKRLRARSQLIRALSREVCESDLIRISRLAAGRSAHPGSDTSLMGFREGIDLVVADVEETLEELWRSFQFPSPNLGK